MARTPILPSIQSPLGALPRRFRRTRILVVGCGDVGCRVVRRLNSGQQVLALTSSPARLAELRALGVTPLLGNLDNAASLRRLSGLAQRVVHLAPPPGQGWADTRSQNLVSAVRLRGPPSALVYGSTSGVYGDCQGDWVDETHAPKPLTPRAVRRVDAEARLRHLGRSSGTRVSVLRIPGIYAPDRANGTPEARLRKGTPVLRPEDDVYTNHIHADDLARACLSALWRGKPQRIYNVSDDTHLKMGDYFDWAADHYGLPRPPRVPRSTAQAELPLMLLSFMNESRRLSNTRMKRELGVRLQFVTVQDGFMGSK